MHNTSEKQKLNKGLKKKILLKTLATQRSTEETEWHADRSIAESLNLESNETSFRVKLSFKVLNVYMIIANDQL